MLSASVVSAAITGLPGRQLLYLGQDLTFEAPVYVGDTVRTEATVVEYTTEDRLLVDTEATTVSCTGYARLLVVGG